MGGQNGGAALFLEWQYLIFVLPFAVGALLLLLSSLRVGGHGHGAGHHFGGHGVGHAGGHGLGHGHHPGTGHAAAPTAHHGAHANTHTTPGTTTHPHHGASRTTEGSRSAAQATPLTISMLLFGVGRAPLPMVIEFFLICWGIAGLWAVGNLVHAPHPNLFQMIPSLFIAFGGGWAGSRGAAEVIGRIMPHDETSVISQNALFGLTGKVAFPVSEKSGRVHIYDEFGTLHDEMCRVPDGHPLITRGSTVRVADVDLASGRLLVELVSPPPKSAGGAQ